MNALVTLGETQDKIFNFINKIKSSEEAVLEILNPTQTGSQELKKQSKKSKLNEIFGTEYQGIEYEIPEILKSGVARLSNNNIYYLNQVCILHAFFITTLLHAEISLRLKILILSDLNLLGYMFDRTPENYRINDSIISKLIKDIIIFKLALSPEDLRLWNAGTLGGQIDGQVLSFSLFSRVPGISIFDSEIIR